MWVHAVRAWIGAAALCLAVQAQAAESHVDIAQCWTVGAGRAEIVSYPAERLDGTPVTLDGLLSLPGSATPVPGIVILPGARGLITPSCYGGVAMQFVDWGFAVLVVAPRTAHDAAGRNLFQYSFADLGNYAHGAAAALGALAPVDADHIGLWGHSNGGMAVLDVVAHSTALPGVVRAAVAAAPICPARAVQPVVPLLVLMGSADEALSPDWCVAYAEKMADTEGFEFVLLRGGNHSFWASGAPGNSPAAAALAEARLRRFLDRYVVPPR